MLISLLKKEINNNTRESHQLPGLKPILRPLYTGYAVL